MYYCNLICPYTKKSLKFISKDLGSIIYKTYNEDIFFKTIPFCENIIKEIRGKNFRYFLIESNELYPLLKLKYGWIKSPSIFQKLFYPILELILSVNYSTVKIIPTESKEELNDIVLDSLNVEFDHPDLYSINRGDKLRLEKHSKFIIIIVRNIFDSMITTDTGQVYDLCEWKYLRII